MAAEAGLAAHALTDHDCLDGLTRFREAADGFEPIDGVEVSARFEDQDVHILGLLVDPGNDRLQASLASLAETRLTRTDRMVERLREAGLDITVEQVIRHARRGTVGRPHVALAIMELGAATTMDEAFRKYLRPRTPGFVPKPGPDPGEAIDWIHGAGGVAVLAHPGLLRKSSWIERFAALGLDGLEVWHPKHAPPQRERLAALASRLDLVPSGGSDYHGKTVGDALIGQEPVPLETLDRLRARRSRTRG
jgi:hypothetical protein